MRILIITSATKKEIEDLIDLAEQMKIPIDEMEKIAAGSLPPIGNNKLYSIEIQVGFRVVFSIEEHPGGWFKHLSISVRGKGNWPNMNAVEAIANEFGILDLKRQYIYPEYEVEAINIISKY